MKKRFGALFLCSVLFSGNLLAQTLNNFISVADIHFNPFYACKKETSPCQYVLQLKEAAPENWSKIFKSLPDQQISYYGEDTNYPLLESALEVLQEVNEEEKPVFALLIGDFIAHNFRQHYIRATGDKTQQGFVTFTRKTFAFLGYEFAKALPHLTFYGVVGNNDSYTGNYISDANGPFFHDIAKIFASLVHDSNGRKDLLASFPYAGYYAVTLPEASNLRLIVLNTVLFSPKDKGTATKKAAEQQLAWLHDELTRAAQNKQQVLLTFHIPPGIDVFGTLRTKFSEVKQFWQAEYTRQFERELKQFPSVTKEVLPAHIHMDAFQLITFKNFKAIPVIFTPSVSPVYGNNPGFKVFTFDTATFQLKNYDTYYLPLKKGEKDPEWHEEYSFNQTYDFKFPCRLENALEAFLQNQTLIEKYQNYYFVQGHQQASIKSKWNPYYRCNMNTINVDHYLNCLK